MSEHEHRLRRPVSDEDWTRGPAEAPVTLVEYLDFECPHCQRAYPIIERVLNAFADRVRFVARHFPVTSTHPHAEQAAQAAEAAGRQGEFWEMYHRLFEAKGRLSQAELREYAREIGLGPRRFLRDLEDPALAAKIREQKYLGMRSGVNGTPTLFINGLRHDGPVEEEALREALEEAAQRVAREAA